MATAADHVRTATPLQMRCGRCDSMVPLREWQPGQRDESVRCSQCGHSSAERNGVILLGTRPTDDMPDDFYDILAEAEPRHFWFGARNRLILSTLQEVVGRQPGTTVLDVGCGTGFVTAAIERAGMAVCGIDMHEVGLHFARRRMRGPLLCVTATGLPFRDQFDVAMLCDVLEHCPDDVAVLRDVSGAVRPGGVLAITVPAHQRLWTSVDDISGHKRRYDASMLQATIEGAGLGVRLIRYFNALLLPIQVLQRLTMRRQPTATLEERERVARQSLTVPPAPLNRLLADLLAADLLLSRMPLTVGTSLIAVAERRQAAPA